MSITTHTSTIRQYVKNHTKDDIALFFEHQFVAKEAEIERLKAENAELESELEVYQSAVRRQLKRIDDLEKLAGDEIEALQENG